MRREILAEVGAVGGTAIPPEEVGFLTMYLAGSLERQRLRQKIRVTVVCPAGMATAWILVSRLLAEFPAGRGRAGRLEGRVRAGDAATADRSRRQHGAARADGPMCGRGWS